MGFLQDIVHAITGGGGHPQQAQASPMLAQKIAPSNFQHMQPMQMKPQMGTGGQPVQSSATPPYPVAGYLTHMQNGPEFAAGEREPLSAQMLQHAYLSHPQIQGQIGQQHGMASNYATPIQGRQNPGFIPVQGSRGVMPIQGGMSPQPFNVQSGNYNPQQAQITF